LVEILRPWALHGASGRTCATSSSTDRTDRRARPRPAGVPGSHSSSAHPTPDVLSPSIDVEATPSPCSRNKKVRAVLCAARPDRRHPPSATTLVDTGTPCIRPPTRSRASSTVTSAPPPPSRRRHQSGQAAPTTTTRMPPPFMRYRGNFANNPSGEDRRGSPRQQLRAEIPCDRTEHPVASSESPPSSKKSSSHSPLGVGTLRKIWTMWSGFIGLLLCCRSPRGTLRCARSILPLAV